MCDESDYAVGAVLGQWKKGWVHAVYYASKTHSETQLSYATTEKEFLAVVFCDRTAQNNFVLSPMPVHVAIKQ
jgi:hypothetical protein